LTGCPRPRSESQLPILAHITASPDDLTVDSAGNLWVSELAANLIAELSSSGQRLATVSDPGGPEGIAALPDGRLVVADQRSNARSIFRPGDVRVSPIAPPTPASTASTTTLLGSGY
jgi:streptogramin lyase